eukprot:CAMPEP_0184323448 /NCGR_PEP_ID=MMETSP1049-20130417/130421_1 /TAXON_ID=77928 /ORGANISM="Proteomonas sulcata, Strain CCMP704" /LENGTH=65 /DNA_ID=CAMNT_0026644957 /DNA_START=540 /DNA_END=733 /DNA_ORIENTATION=+
MVGEIEGLEPSSVHGLHIHELGDLSEGCSSLGGHYNPFQVEHAGPYNISRHVGDLGNIKADPNGV